MPVITANHLRKTYQTTIRKAGLKGALISLVHAEKKEVEAVKDVSFSIEEGEIVGYIGPNGAGKSTTIKMMTGVLTPTEGEISVCGISPQKDRIQNAMNIGVVFGQRTQLWWDLPVNETFELVRRMYELDDGTFQKNLAEYVEILGLSSFMNRPVRQLSLGQRMRAEIAAALLHNPRVLFLDEPTIGLDVEVKHKMRDFIRHINENRKVTVLLTTHDLQDIEELSSRIIVINHGKLGFNGTLNDLYGRSNFRRSLLLTFERAPAKPISLPGFEGLADISVEGMTGTIKFDPSVSASSLIARVMEQTPIQDIDIKGPLIDDIVMEVYDEADR